jgi:hypothetical protein
MRKRKALKGGNFKFNNPTLAGPVLKETLYRAKNEDIININNTYIENLEQAEKELQRTYNIKKQAEEQAIKEVKLEQEENKQIQAANKDRNILIQKYMVSAGNVVAFLLSSFARIFKFAINFFKTNILAFLKLAGSAGQGAIIKVIIAIVIIVLIILGATDVIHGFKGPEMPDYKDFGQSLLSVDPEKYLVMPKQDNFFTMMSKSVNNMIPGQYKYKWASISNSITYMTSGKNIYDNFLEPRDEIDTGRSDNIFNINFNNDPNYTTSIIKPKPVKLEFNSSMYYDADYNKIDETIMTTLQDTYHNKCIIPIEANNNNKYALDLTNTEYYNDNKKIDNSKKLIKNIFVQKKSDINFNIFDNILYSEFYDIKNIIAAYSTKLINPNYKGPILRLSTADKIYKQYNKEHKTANFYNKYKTDYLYCIIQNKEISFNEYFKVNIAKRDAIYVMGLYDQSGNDHHFSYEDHDNKYMPEYHQSYMTYNNVIKFYSRSILFLTKPISYNKMKLIINMDIQNDITTNADLNIADAAIKTAINNKDTATSTLNNAVDAKNRAQITAEENGNRRSFKYTEEDAQDEAAEAAIKTNYEKENRQMLEENAQKVVDAVAEPFTDNNSEELTAALEAQKNAQDTYDKVIELLNKPNYIQNTRSLLNANQRKELSQEFQRIRDRLDKATNEVNRIRNKEQKLNEITTRRNARLNARRDEESVTTEVPDVTTLQNAINDASNNLKSKENALKSAQDNYNNNKSNYVDTYMDFLAKRGSSTVKITINDATPKIFNIEYNENKTKIENNIIFDIENKTDNITFECLGNILDPRSDHEKRFDDNGKNLGEMIHKHSFRGLLSELRIFKNA